ncbi:MAG: hypothetical protein LBV45_02585 [Xanthomonadaceae bacterium]|jgi:hypothetical protein|nr:hypothetical protein [Xanthomonadaceae bacterium]
MNEDTFAEIELRRGAVRVTAADLEQIKVALAQALSEQESPDFAPLLAELDDSACMILSDGTARIGGWKLKPDATGQSLLLEHQPAQRSAAMLFYIARLQFHEGRWSVPEVTIRKVRGR